MKSRDDVKLYHISVVCINFSANVDHSNIVRMSIEWTKITGLHNKSLYGYNIIPRAYTIRISWNRNNYVSILGMYGVVGTSYTYNVPIAYNLGLNFNVSFMYVIINCQ